MLLQFFKKRKAQVKALLLGTLCLVVGATSLPLAPAVAAEKKEVTFRYFTEEQIFQGNASSFIKNTADVDALKRADNFSITTEFKTEIHNGNVQSLFSIGSDVRNQENNYINLYFIGNRANTGKNRLGVEVRRGTDNKHFYYDLPERINDGTWHSVAFTIKNQEEYALYLDGEQVVRRIDKGARFIRGTVDAANYIGFGGTDRFSLRNNPNSLYYFTGSLKNTKLFVEYLNPLEIAEMYVEDAFGAPVYNNYSFDFVREQTPYELEDMPALTEVQNYTLTAHFHTAENKKMSLLSLEGENGKNADFYVDLQENKLGFSVFNGENRFSNEINLPNVLDKSSYHSVSYVVDKAAGSIRYYLDRTLIATQQTSLVQSLADIAPVTTAHVGAKVVGEEITQNFKGGIENLSLHSVALPYNAVKGLHLRTLYVAKEGVLDPNARISTPQKLFFPGMNGSATHRIPSLLTTSSGTIIAAIDRRNQHAADWGDIDTIIRRSKDNGVTWEDEQLVIDLVDNRAGGSQHSSFLIDPVMVQDRSNNRIFLFVDMFPESRGFFSATVGSGYREINGTKYLELYSTTAGDNRVFTVRENGVVYDDQNQPTDYRLPQEASAENGFSTLGDLYQNGIKVGNVYMKNQGPFKIRESSYIWMTYSDNDGETWAKPVDLTPMVKEDWMQFMGVGPGVGIQLQNGRLVIPVYHTNRHKAPSQSTAVIYSDDHGVTWRRSESPNDGRVVGNTTLSAETLSGPGESNVLTEAQLVQLNNGSLRMFMRNRSGYVMMATSRDNGTTWENELTQLTDIRDPYCQLSVIHYGDHQGKETLVLSNPNASDRSNGTLRLAEVNGDEIRWTHSQVVDEGQYAYSSITKLPNGNIGVLYEAQSLDIPFVSMNLDWIKSPVGELPAASPYVTNVATHEEGENLFIYLTFSERVYVTGVPLLQLSLGEQALEAEYVAGTASNELVFRYQKSGEEEGDLKAVGYDKNTGNLLSVKTKEAVFAQNLIKTFSERDQVMKEALARDILALMEEYVALTPELYTDLSQMLWADALQHAETVMENPDATVKEMKKARDLLAHTKNGLVLKEKKVVRLDNTESNALPVHIEGEYSSDLTLKVHDVSNVKAVTDVEVLRGKDFKVYDIYIADKATGNVVPVHRNHKVKIAMDKKVVAVYYLPEKKGQAPERLDFKYDEVNKILEFGTDHFSHYAFVTTDFPNTTIVIPGVSDFSSLVSAAANASVASNVAKDKGAKDLVPNTSAFREVCKLPR